MTTSSRKLLEEFIDLYKSYPFFFYRDGFFRSRKTTAKPTLWCLITSSSIDSILTAGEYKDLVRFTGAAVDYRGKTV